MTTNTTAHWHDLDARLTDHQRELLASLEWRFAQYRNCNLARIDELLFIHAAFYAGVQR